MLLLFIFMALSDDVLSYMHLLMIGVKGTRRKNATSEQTHMPTYTKVMNFFSKIFKRNNCRFITKLCRTCIRLFRKHIILFAVLLFIPSPSYHEAQTGASLQAIWLIVQWHGSTSLLQMNSFLSAVLDAEHWHISFFLCIFFLS